MHQGDDLRSVLAGASGLVLVPERGLIDAITHAATGGMLRPDALTGRLTSIVTGEARGPLDGGERRILGFISEGYPDLEIAARLGVSLDDVRDQIARIAEKLS